MKIEEQIKNNIQGLIILSSPLHHDERGYFVENWRKMDLLQYGVPELSRLGEVNDRCFRYVSYVFYRFAFKFSKL